MVKNQEQAEMIQIIKNGSDKQIIQTLTTLLTQHTTKQLDISPYFSDIIKHIFTNNLELKKLIYIYLLSVSSEQLADQLLLSVNAFLKDTRDEHAMIRSIALRTMSSIGGTIVTQYLPEPILRLLKDNDPFVRKTAVVAAIKLFKVNRQLFFQSNIDVTVVNTLLDGNQAVISNTASVLIEMQQEEPLHDCVLAAIPQANEFGVIGLLNWLTINFTPKTEFELSSAIDKAGARLTSKNSAVCIAALKLLLKLAEFCDDNSRAPLCVRLSVAINSLLSSESEEIVYLAAKTAVDIAAAYQNLINIDIRASLPHFNERSGVKLTKIQLLIQIANEGNSQFIIEELVDLAISDVDRNVVSSLVDAIGKIAIKVPAITNFAVQKIVQMVENITGTQDQVESDNITIQAQESQTSTTYSVVVESALITIYNIMQVYPNEYTGAIIPILQNLQQINKNEAKIALLKIIENFAGNISNAEDILIDLIDEFETLDENVQLALITASVKIFLCFQTDNYERLTMKVLKLATGLDTDANVVCSPDVIERAYFYWRLLSMPEGIQTASQWLFQEHQVDQERLSGQVDSQAAYNRCKEMGKWSSISGKQWVQNVQSKQTTRQQSQSQTQTQTQEQTQSQTQEQTQEDHQKQDEDKHIEMQIQQTPQEAQPQQKQPDIDPFADIFN